MVSCPKTRGKVSCRIQVDLQGEASSKWECGETYGQICGQVVLSGGGNILWGYLCSSSKVLFNQIYSSTFSIDGMEDTLDGCEDNFPQWSDWGRGVHRVSRSILDLRQRVTHVQTQVSAIFIETSTQCLVYHDRQLFHRVRLHQKWSRWKPLPYWDWR